jgi:hypothetical protein
VKGEKTTCDDPKFVVEKEKTYFCAPPRIAGHKANTDFNNDPLS